MQCWQLKRSICRLCMSTRGFQKSWGYSHRWSVSIWMGSGRMAGGRVPAKAVVKSSGSDIIKHRTVPQMPASTLSKKVEAGSIHDAEKYYEKHVFGTMKTDMARIATNPASLNRYSQLRIILTISADEVQDIINRKSGTGIVRVDRNGNARNVEDITLIKNRAVLCKGKFSRY